MNLILVNLNLNLFKTSLIKGVLFGKKVFIAYPILCKFSSSSITISCSASLLSMEILAFNR